MKNLKGEEINQFIITPFLDEDSFNFNLDEIINKNEITSQINPNNSKDNNEINIIEKESENKLEKKEKKENTSNILKHSLTMNDSPQQKKNITKIKKDEHQNEINNGKK